MNKKEIEALIHRYFEAETSLEEEQLLRAYFQRDEVDEQLKIYEGYFNYFRSQGEIKAPEHLAGKVLQTIQKEANNKKGIRVLRLLSRVAAVFILGIGLWFLYKPGGTGEEIKPTASSIDWSKYEVKSEEEAIKVMQMALRKTSTELKKGTNIATTEIHTTKERWAFLK